MMLKINPLISDKFRKEDCCELFRHDGLLCLVKRMNWNGNINGYVAVDITHPLYGREYSDKVVVPSPEDIKYNGNIIGAFCLDVDEFESGLVPLDIAINVHGGLTFSRAEIAGIEKDVFGDLWWFGFDTVHSGDMKVFLSDIDLQFDTSYNEEYRDFEYVKEQTINLANQLKAFIPCPNK